MEIGKREKERTAFIAGAAFAHLVCLSVCLSQSVCRKGGGLGASDLGCGQEVLQLDEGLLLIL